MKNIALLLVFVVNVSLAYANGPLIIQEQIEWNETSTSIQLTPSQSINMVSFKDAVIARQHPSLPLYIKQFPIDQYGTMEIELTNEVYEPLTRPNNQDDDFIKNQIEIKSRVEISRRKAYGRVEFIPIRKNPSTGSIEKLISFDLKIIVKPKSIPALTALAKSGTSILATDNVYKLRVNQTGITQLSYDFLKNELGISDLDNIDPRTIKLYGNGGGFLPEANATDRADDLIENAIQIVGEEDGSFDQNDYILFYGESANMWAYFANNDISIQRQNPYDAFNHYFIKTGSGNGLRIETQSSVNNTLYTSTSFDDYSHHEEEIINLLGNETYAHGSGKVWFGESFKFTRERVFDFSFPNLITTDSVKVIVNAAARLVGNSSNYSVSLNNDNIGTMNYFGVSADVEQPYARWGTSVFETNANSDNIAIKLNYNAPSTSAAGWLNYITLNVRRALTFTNGQMAFRDRKTLAHYSTTFTINNANNSVRIWDVSTPTIVTEQAFTANGNQLSFGANTSTLKEFIAFDGSSYLSAEAIGRIDNQDLHSLNTPELLIVYHPDFEAAVMQLKTHREVHSGITVETVPIQSIYNEFSSGNQDPTAIRDFVKHLYDKSTDLKYLLLFGDASYDYKNLRNDSENHHYVPTYETWESIDPIDAFPSDDYYGLLDFDEGNNPSTTGGLDIGIGRIPVRTIIEANQAVDKIIRYDTDIKTFGDWKNKITFAADDEDTNTHLSDANTIADNFLSNNPVYNVNKIFFDAYQQEILPAGERYPQAKAALNANLFNGTFVLCYLGHGDSEGWAQERVLTIADVNAWTNRNKLPLLITATCSFGPFDDPTETSIGELMFLKNNGGVTALFTTVRAVYSSYNKKLTNAVFNNMIANIDGKAPRLGDILRLSKSNCNCNTENSRKFTLIGDPSMTLSYPEYNVVTTKINGNIITTSDTIKALEEVTIEGEVRDETGNLMTDFNGTIYPTLYDKTKVLSGLGNDNGSLPARSFDLQNNILFRGRASVTNGKFSFNFIIPKDIDYEYGYGKISYYAEDGLNREANGFYDTIVIGGTNLNVLPDNEGPLVQVFMNNEDFVFGGITDANPVIYVKMSDDNGINTSSSSIGHDITALLDDNAQQTYTLNDFYESALNNFREGTAKYPLSDLEEGRHTVSVKAWDISNNAGTGSTEFVVSSSANIALKHVLNYPNPFTTNTEFQFEHNVPNQPVSVQVQIFTVSGKLVKTIQEEIIADGYRVTGINWDGLDDYGNNIGRGVYVYKVSLSVLASDGAVTASESQFEKLVILK